MLKTVLRQLRKTNNLTQEEVADYLHIQRATYSRYENGTNSVSLEILCKLADLYNVSTDFLLQRNQNINKNRSTDLLRLYLNADNTHRDIAVTVLKMGQTIQAKKTIESYTSYLPVMNTNVTSILLDNDKININGISNYESEIITGDFAVIASDDSMKIAGISKGDYAVIRPQRFINHGEIALIHIGNRFVLRTVYEQEGFIKLIPSNEQYSVEYYEKKAIIIAGRVIKILKP